MPAQLGGTRRTTGGWGRKWVRKRKEGGHNDDEGERVAMKDVILMGTKKRNKILPTCYISISVSIIPTQQLSVSLALACQSKRNSS